MATALWAVVGRVRRVRIHRSSRRESGNWTRESGDGGRCSAGGADRGGASTRSYNDVAWGQRMIPALAHYVACGDSSPCKPNNYQVLEANLLMHVSTSLQSCVYPTGLVP
jgi:hypothetical protein